MGSHLIVMHSAVRACPGYSRHDAPSIVMEGTSVALDTEHGLAVAAQLRRRQATLSEAIDAGVAALSAAHVSKGVRRQARAAAEDYFYTRLGLSPELDLGSLRELDPGSREPMPEPMYRALENVVELVVDGDYEALEELSEGRLSAEDLRRRVEDDCPAALVLPPREHYVLDALAQDEEHGETGWSYFLDLWDEHGAAQLHIEGELEESGERLRPTLDDIGP